MAVLNDLIEGDYDVVSPRGVPCRELRDYSFSVAQPGDERVATRDPERDAVMSRYLSREFALYESRERRASEFARAAKFWESLANPDGTVNSAYGWLIWGNKSCGGAYGSQPQTPWEWARDSLLRDRDTRQAFLRFSLPEHQWDGNKDITCTMHANFLIRRGRLHMTAVMRSNDVVKGLAYDMPFFCRLQLRMLSELVAAYPDLKLGHYAHFVHSMHLYERDLDTACGMLYGR